MWCHSKIEHVWFVYTRGGYFSPHFYGSSCDREITEFLKHRPHFGRPVLWCWFMLLRLVGGKGLPQVPVSHWCFWATTWQFQRFQSFRADPHLTRHLLPESCENNWLLTGTTLPPSFPSASPSNVRVCRLYCIPRIKPSGWHQKKPHLYLTFHLKHNLRQRWQNTPDMYLSSQTNQKNNICEFINPRFNISVCLSVVNPPPHFWWTVVQTAEWSRWEGRCGLDEYQGG